MVGSLTMAAFACTSAWRFMNTHYLYFALICFRDILASSFLLIRSPSTASGNFKQQFIAYFSSALPLLYLASPGTNLSLNMTLVANLMAVAGFLLATLATIELGSRIGISPAFRNSVCRSGVYKWMRHPMYVGYVLMEFSAVLINPINLGILLVSVSCYFWRARAERHVLSVKVYLNKYILN
jgi:protein-S-isoprenylcysteine O-methyltransferase Ste14